MPQLSLGTRLSAGGPLTSLPRRVAAILRKFGSNAHVWMPGPGVPVLGPELVSNGDFATDTWWSKEAGWTISGGAAVATAAADGMYVYRPSLVEAGKTYLVTYTCTEYTSGSFRCNIGGTWGTMRSSAGTFSEVLVATNSAFTYNGIRATGGNTTAKFDNVSVKEITGYSTLLNGFQAANYLEANASGAPQVVDQPVGYVGDAANVTLGANIVGNSTFDDSSWWGFSGATVSGGKLSLITAGTYVGVSKTNILTIGKTYQVEADVVINSGTSGVWVGSTLDGVQRATTGKLTGVFTATAATLEVKRASGSFPLDATVDNVIVREIIGAIPATQSATSNKPILRRVPILGPELVMNGDFSAGATNWTPGSNWQLSGNEMLSLGTGGTYLSTQGANLITAGKTYLCRFEIKTQTVVGGGVSIGVGTGTAGPVINSGPGVYTCTLTAGANGYVFLTARGSGPFWQGTVDNISVREITGYRDAYYWEFDGTDDTLTMAAPLFQVNDDMAVITGVTMSRLTSNARIFSQWGAGASFFRLYVDQATRNVFAAWNDDSATGVVPASPGQLNYGVPAVLSAVKSGAGRYVRKNGVAGSTAGNVLSGASSLTSAAICSQAGGAYFVGSIYTVIAIKGTVTDADLKILEKWVGQQAGVQIV